MGREAEGQRETGIERERNMHACIDKERQRDYMIYSSESPARLHGGLRGI